MLQETPDKVNDLVSLLLEAANEVVEQKDATTGKIKQVVIPDSESIWMQTKMVNSPTFARYILTLRKLYSLGINASNYMCKERADVLQKQVIGLYKDHKYSIDSKSSETLRDKHNSQSSLNHIILRQHQERSVTVKGEAKKTALDAMMGREARESGMD